MSRGARAWLLLGWAGLLVLPWYGFETWRDPGALLPAVAQAVGKPWLWPLFAAQAWIGWAALRGQGRGLVASCAAGLAWLVLEAALILHRGWALDAFGVAQPALGWGALAFVLGALGLAAIGFARQGACRGDAFLCGAILMVAAGIAVFVLYPVGCVLVSALRDNDGRLVPALFAEKITSPAIWGLGCLGGASRSCGVAWNTLFVGAIVGAATTLLGLALALLAQRTRVVGQPVMRLLSVLPIITPPFVIGLALILLFGRAGMVTNFLADTLDIPRTRWIYGFWGIAIAQTLAFTPIAFLVLRGVLQGVSPSLEEASQTLRAQPLRTFRTVTWPLIRPGLANAFLIGFTESMADFANPLVIGGNFSVLATDIFFAVVGAAHDQGRAAVLSIVLLAFTLAVFCIQRAWVGRALYTTVSGKGDAGLHAKLPGSVRTACLAGVLPFLVLTVAVYGIILVGGFVRNIGRDNTPTLEYFWTAFGVERGVAGWFLSGSAWSSFLTTMQLALVAMPITACFGLLAAYLLDRVRFPGRAAFEFVSMLSFAIPGTVIGIAYVLAFNVPPLQLTGTGTIIVLAFVFRNMPVGIRAGLATLAQIDRSLDEASLTLGARSFATLRRVLLPLLRPAVVAAMIYGFVRAVTAVSAVIFLTTGEWNLATVYIVGRADVGEYGIAIVYSAVLIVTMSIALALIGLLVGERRIGRRTAQPVVVAAA